MAILWKPEEWDAYDASVRKACYVKTPTTKKFQQNNIAQGVIDLPADSAEIVERAELVAFTSGLTSPGYETAQFTAAQEREINATSHFRIIAGPLAELMRDCVGQLKPVFAELLGTPWRIFNVRVYTTTPASNVLMYAWHRDGYPLAVIKAMFYFTPLDHAHGGFEIHHHGGMVLLKGPANSWVLFDNSIIMHRGVAGAEASRAAAEITLARSREFDLELHQPGLNAYFPVHPT